MFNFYLKEKHALIKIYFFYSSHLISLSAGIYNITYIIQKCEEYLVVDVKVINILLLNQY